MNKMSVAFLLLVAIGMIYAASVPCPATYFPVCSTAGISYANDCLMQSRGETMACWGECPCSTK